MHPDRTCSSLRHLPGWTSILTLVALAGLLAAGCSDPDGGPDDVGTAAPSATPSPLPSPSPSPDASPTPAQTNDHTPLAVQAPSIDTQCVLEPEAVGVDRISYAVPGSWQVDGRCDILDPELDELPEDTEVDAAVFIDVADVAFSEAVEASPATEDVTRYLGARAGHQTLRATGVATGAAMSEEGQPVTRWTIDLDDGTDDDGGVLTLSTGARSGDGYALAATVVDLVAQTVVLTPVAGGDRTVVARAEGGGTPYAVTWDGSCFALRPGGPTEAATDELCELDPTAGDIVTGMLGDGVLVGYAPPTAVAVALPAGQPPFGLTTSVEGSSIFAMRVADDPGEVTALAAGGAPITTVPTD